MVGPGARKPSAGEGKYPVGHWSALVVILFLFIILISALHLPGVLNNNNNNNRKIAPFVPIIHAYTLRVVGQPHRSLP